MNGRGARHWLQVARAMSWSTRIEYVKVAALASVSELGLRWVTLERTAQVLRVRCGGTEATTSGSAIADLPLWARRRLHVVSVVMRRWPVDGTCLRHSLVAGNRLRRLRPILRIGVTTDPVSRIAAHAWLEIGGRSLDPTHQRYHALSLTGR